MLRILALLAAAVLLAAGLVLGSISVIAVRRNEGVFLPAGYVALFCLAGSYFLARAVLRP
ncbi:MAG: hypothetical protein JWN79_315 [Gemmatimonadetes bacterium]|jgi:hypothetical protein|nr:hypothetical protein [Gemmatimonadota bacterium]